MLIVGGFLTEPVLYRALRDRLLERDAASVGVAPIHVVDWAAAGIAGLGPLLVRTGLTVRRTHRRTGGRPILVVGHSGGGILARLALSPVAYDGRIAAVGDAVGAVVTLGTPHGLHAAQLRWRHPGARAAAFLAQVDASTPSGSIASDRRTPVVTVGSTAVPALSSRHAPVAARLANLPFRLVAGPIGPSGGDGIVGVDLAHLPGARQVTLADATHGTFGPRWYGDAAVIDRWWPVALDAWREALEARSRGGSPDHVSSGDAADQPDAGSVLVGPESGAPSGSPAVPVTFRGD